MYHYDVIGDPGDQAMHWEQQMGPDTCAVMAERSLIEQFTGISLSEEEAAYISASNGWYHPGGGTPTSDVGNLMDLYGIQNHRVMNATISDLANELQAGHGVIVGIHSSELWEDGLLADLKHALCKGLGLDNSSFNPADHAVCVTGIDVTNPDNPMVILNDSGHAGGAGVAYPLDKFMDAWENSDFYYIATDNAIPEIADTDSINWGQWISDFASYAAGGFAAGVVIGAGGDLETGINIGIEVGSMVENFFSDPDAICMI